MRNDAEEISNVIVREIDFNRRAAEESDRSMRFYVIVAVQSESVR